jgi:hypothetical protein
MGYNCIFTKEECDEVNLKNRQLTTMCIYAQDLRDIIEKAIECISTQQYDKALVELDKALDLGMP